MALEEKSNVIAQPADNAKIKKLWTIAGYLFVLTVIEFIFAYVLPRGVLLYTIFVTLTLVKAFYIVGEFMHLKYEVKVLIWSIVIPSIFVVWLVIALIYEGGAIFNVR
ncbi:MAG: cytochrome C oxidase subunit IV family protein [Cyclobacteriaceae bacterium]|nr:cytochrome C oxidase subunit IV family protein [Cyclobacteriaceae bacterium]